MEYPFLSLDLKSCSFPPNTFYRVTCRFPLCPLTKSTTDRHLLLVPRARKLCPPANSSLNSDGSSGVVLDKTAFARSSCLKKRVTWRRTLTSRRTPHKDIKHAHWAWAPEGFSVRVSGVSNACLLSLRDKSQFSLVDRDFVKCLILADYYVFFGAESECDLKICPNGFIVL